MKLKAFGKINLSLDITGKRENGYHDVSMVMQSVSLYDEVTVEKNDKGRIFVTTDCADLPCDEQNLAYRACAFMKEKFDLPCGFDVFIAKHIPIAGGMAGGSTDCAAVLKAINVLCNLELSTEALMQLGLTLGADIPFCIQEKPALATGIGEVLTPVSGLSEDLWLLLVNPNEKLSTKLIYELVDNEITYGQIDNTSLIQALADENVNRAAEYMVNVMQIVSEQKCEAIKKVIQGLRSMGAIHAMMSGSGATCFGIFTKKPDAELVNTVFGSYWTQIAKPLNFVD